MAEGPGAGVKNLPQRGPWQEKYPFPTGTPSTPPTPPLDDEDQTAYDLMVNMLKEWGLEALAGTIRDFLIDGYSQDQIGLMLQDTEPYKARFAGNTARRAAGLRALSPAEYLAVEGSYRQIMSRAGLPGGFYDSPEDFAGWIGGDVSPQEIQGRVDLATDAAQRLDDGTKAAFRDWYGVGETDLAAFFLDRERAEPALQRIARGVQLGGGLKQQGLDMTRERAEQLAGFVGNGQVDQAVGAIAEATRGGQRLGGIYGQDYSQRDAEDEVVLGSEAAKRRRRDLAAMETGTFSGASGIGRSSLGTEKKNF